MAFSFSTSPAPPPESPIERRQRPILRWQDSAVTIDSWLVEFYQYRPDDTVSPLSYSFYLKPQSTSTNLCGVVLDDVVQPAVEYDYYYGYDSDAQAFAPYPALGVLDAVGVCRAYQIQIYSVTDGVKSAMQGSFNFIYLAGAKKQQWNWTGYESIFEYYPISPTVKGWLTDREVTDAYIRYDMALEDEGVANALYLGNYSYEFETGKNTNEASWDEVKYTIYDRGVARDFLTLDKPADTNSFLSGTFLNIPIGPANIKDNAGWFNGYDINVEPWDYIEIKLVDSSDDDAQKGRAIRVYPDCRPQKHKPAQLYWMGTKGAEMLRFDGRVQDSYDVSGRESFKTGGLVDDGVYGGDGNLNGVVSYLPSVVQGRAEGKRSFSLSEDFFTQAERELFKTAVTATHMMVRYDGKWYPCILKTTNYTHEQPSSRLAPIRLEVEIAQPLSC